MPHPLPPPTRAEAVALFRLGVVGDLLARDLAPGELRDALISRAAQRYRPPGATATRSFHWKTLQSWYYAARHGGHKKLTPKSRRKGFATQLTADQRTLLIQIRRENPSAPADLILDTAVGNGVVARHQVSVSTLRRLFAAVGTTRTAATHRNRRERRRWDSGRVGAIWHADVCHVWVLNPETRLPEKVYVHGMLDDHSRYILALEGRHHETENDWLAVLCSALLRFPAPDALYLDNGACYRGDTLKLACARLGIKLLHAEPFDPQARGKMERFWKTFRSRCADHLGDRYALQDVNLGLLAYLDADYHHKPHSGLMGETPARRFGAGLAPTAPLTAKQLADALEVTVTRKVSNALTFSLGAKQFEVRGRHLAGETATIVIDPFTDAPLRVLVDGKPVVFGLCDALANARAGRGPAEPEPVLTTSFDPILAMIQKARKVTK